MHDSVFGVLRVPCHGQWTMKQSSEGAPEPSTRFPCLSPDAMVHPHRGSEEAEGWDRSWLIQCSFKCEAGKKGSEGWRKWQVSVGRGVMGTVDCVFSGLERSSRNFSVATRGKD